MFRLTTSTDLSPVEEDDATLRWFRKEEGRRLANEAERLAGQSDWFPLIQKGDWMADGRTQRQFLKDIRWLISSGMDDETPSGRGRLELAIKLADHWIERAEQQALRRKELGKQTSSCGPGQGG